MAYLFLTVLPILLNARYNAFVTSNGTDNPSCNQSTPCGLFQFVISNARRGNIPNDDLYIYINGSNPFMNGTTHYYSSYGSSSHCRVDLKGNITFVFDSETIRTTADWFGSSVLDLCPPDACPLFTCSHNLVLVPEGSNVTFYDLVWDISLPFLHSLGESTFHCEGCIIRDFSGNFTTFLLAKQATFKDCVFQNITTDSLFELTPVSWLTESSFIQTQTDTVLTLTGCSVSDISSPAFIDISASFGMFISHKRIADIGFKCVSESIPENVVVVHIYILHLVFEKSVIIENSNFSATDSSTTWIYVSLEYTFSNGITNRFTIELSAFSGAFQMLRIEDTADCEVTINSVNVTYSQFLPTEWLENTTWNDDSIITIHSESTVLSMKNVVVTAEMHCSCYDFTGSHWTELPYCNSPTPFLINQECSLLVIFQHEFL